MISFALVEGFGQIKHRKTMHPPVLRGSHHTNNGYDHHQDWAGIVTLLVRSVLQSREHLQERDTGDSLLEDAKLVCLFELEMITA
jgi:hypothetical protein